MPFTTMFKINNDEVGVVGREVKSYNIDHHVSTFGGGAKVDVMLLQALFRIFYYEYQGYGGIDPPGGSSGVIKVDGICGAQLRMHIHHYQNYLMIRGATKTTDGVICPYKKQGMLTTHTHVKYQLEILNAQCYRLAREYGDEGVHQNMTDPKYHPPEVYPPALCNALRCPPRMA